MFPSLRIVRVHLSVSGDLSRVSWQLSSTVVRGGTNSNVGPLLDHWLSEGFGRVGEPYLQEFSQLGLSYELWDRNRPSSSVNLVDRCLPGSLVGHWLRSKNGLAYMRNQSSDAFREFHDFAFAAEFEINQIVARRRVIHRFS